MLRRVSVLGAGSWGTALAFLFSRRCQSLALWARSSAFAAELEQSRTNHRYLPGITLPGNVVCTADPQQAVRSAEIVVLAVPSFAVWETVQLVRDALPASSLLLCAAKGLESGTGRRLSEVVEAAAPGVRERLAVLSGPNLAREAAAGMPTATVVASCAPAAARAIQEALTLPEFRIYTNPDVVGVELGGALKNIIAIAAGLTDGLGYGENTKAALISRGLSEIRRLGRALGARDDTFSGLSGIGDLYATCASNQSRNHRVGYLVGLGHSLDEVLAGMDQVAEGVPTIQAALLMAGRAAVEMPITESLCTVLFHGAPARKTVQELMTRAPADETTV